MALSAKVGDSLRWSPAGENSRIAVSLQLGKSSHHVCAVAPSKSLLNINGSSILLNASRLRQQQGGRERLLVVRASENNNSSNNQTGETGTTNSEADVEALEARLGVGRRARKQQAESGSPPQGSKPAAASAKPKQPGKAWDSMSLAEKAWSVYIDPDKGVLFWLNKLAYGAIFAVIGGWIVFRFIGPALGWYELDAPLLSPDRLLDGP